MKMPLIGTSGWSYEHWNGVFYPKEVKAPKKLHFYSNYFKTVEINSTFYHLPSEKTVRTWHEEVPEDFIFSIKASGYITHRKRLKDPSETIPKFYQVAEAFQEKMGPILFQLPPSLKMDKGRLENFLEALPKKCKHTFEFRHPSWYNEEIYELLKKYRIALCITDLGGSLSPIEITGDFIYIRLHGPKKAYGGSYEKKEIDFWKNKILQWEDQRLQVFCYFDNDEKGHAVQDAKALAALLL